MIVGNCGFGVSPISGAEQMSALYEVRDIRNGIVTKNTLLFYLKNKIAINVGALVGHHTIRRYLWEGYEKRSS